MKVFIISSKRVPKVSQREPKEPKGSQGEPKVSHLEAQGYQKWANGRPKCINKIEVEKSIDSWNTYWFQFGAKNVNKSIQKSMRNRCRQIPENRRTMMRKQTCISICFGIASHEKSCFLKKVHVRESYEFNNRMCVVEGSPKKKESKQRWISVRNSSKNRSRQRKVH